MVTPDAAPCGMLHRFRHNILLHTVSDNIDIVCLHVQYAKQRALPQRNTTTFDVNKVYRFIKNSVTLHHTIMHCFCIFHMCYGGLTTYARDKRMLTAIC